MSLQLMLLMLLLLNIMMILMTLMMNISMVMNNTIGNEQEKMRGCKLFWNVLAIIVQEKVIR